MDFTLGLLIPGEGIARVIGKAGAGLKELRERNNCKVQVQEGTPDPSQPRRVSLSGPIQGCACAAQLALTRAYGRDQPFKATVLIPPTAAGAVVGKQGANLKRVRDTTNVRVTLERDPVTDPATGESQRVLFLEGDGNAMAQALVMSLTGMEGAAPMMQGMAMGPAGLGAMVPGQAPSLMPQPTMSGVPIPGFQHVRPCDPGQIQVHLAVHDKLVGVVVGKEGATIKQLQSETGCTMGVTKRGEGARAIVMVGAPFQVTAVLNVLNQTLAEAAATQPDLGIDMTSTHIIIYVRKEAAGAVIGKAGAALGQVRETCGVKINFGKEESKEQRPCSVTGPVLQVMQAKAMIFDLISQAPLADAQTGGVKRNGDTAFGQAPPTAFSPLASVKRPRPDAAGNPGGDSELKLLVPGQSAGAVIGKGGATLTQIRSTTGVDIKVLKIEEAPTFPQDRVVILRGAASARNNALDQVLRAAFSESTEGASLKLVVPQAVAGAVIGKGGSTLKVIREQSGISPQVERDILPTGERLICATGSLANVLSAAQWIATVIDNNGVPEGAVAGAQIYPVSTPLGAVSGNGAPMTMGGAAQATPNAMTFGGSAYLGSGAAW